MKWTVWIEVTQDSKGPSTSDIGTITQSTGDLLPEQIGLTLEEGRQLLHRTQMAIIGLRFTGAKGVRAARMRLRLSHSGVHRDTDELCEMQ